MRSTLTRVDVARPRCLIFSSASIRLYALVVVAFLALISVATSPAQSPYTPLVEPYTSTAGSVRLRNARNSARVRSSRGGVSAPPWGGARWSSLWARPASRASVFGWSKFANNGVAPNARSGPHWAGVEVSANTRTRPVSQGKTRWPTSPHPTISTRSRRKRAGKAPLGVEAAQKEEDEIKGKIEGFLEQSPRIPNP
jgi:hypothetical protein